VLGNTDCVLGTWPVLTCVPGAALCSCPPPACSCLVPAAELAAGTDLAYIPACSPPYNPAHS